MSFKLLGLALLAAMQADVAVAQTVIQAVPERPRIVVDGYGEAKTPPDLAIITYTVRGEGTTSDHAVLSMTEQGAGIEAALRKIDAAVEPLTGDVKVTPVRSDDCKESDDGSPQLSTGPCAILGYVATQSVTVRTSAVTDAGTMVGLIGRGGAFEAQISNFDLRDSHLAQQRAVETALSDAAAKATAIAAASHVPLGSILSINTTPRREGEEIEVTASRRSNTPPAPAVVAPPPVRVNVKPEPITTGVTVTVTYAIGQ
jgi:uncharacterized protein YggE